ncbi:hypothetical protein D9757_011828 [Collybiopsis confluens]|uniref:Uncharacterized protein n=1 Tax=Collybiopsis confluens TaxID=2823264 RepID=A0A8H5H0H6_9AGAR|nr:hypothetical protein D9757_011828 [Collybiopsis confluens]
MPEVTIFRCLGGRGNSAAEAGQWSNRCADSCTAARHAGVTSAYLRVMSVASSLEAVDFHCRPVIPVNLRPQYHRYTGPYHSGETDDSQLAGCGFERALLDTQKNTPDILNIYPLVEPPRRMASCSFRSTCSTAEEEEGYESERDETHAGKARVHQDPSSPPPLPKTSRSIPIASADRILHLNHPPSDIDPESICFISSILAGDGWSISCDGCSCFPAEFRRLLARLGVDVDYSMALFTLLKVWKKRLRRITATTSLDDHRGPRLSNTPALTNDSTSPPDVNESLDEAQDFVPDGNVWDWLGRLNMCRMQPTRRVRRLRTG